jgi:putative flippase GtrA
MTRWLKFNAVGLLGVALQLAALRLFAATLGPARYLLATALAVELTILHNFAWHARWTWRDRPADARQTLARLLRFNLTNGANSLVGNLLLMKLFVAGLGFPLLPANLCAIGVCGLVNFALSHGYVFRRAAPYAK